MPKEVIEGFRLSPQQKHLWLMQQAGQPQPYRAQCAVRIEGQLKPAILTAALELGVNRHEILRTTFYHLPGTAIPLQVINNDNALAIQCHDLKDFEPAEQAARLDALFDDLSQQPFDLQQGPLWQVALVALTPTRHSLLMSLPALCADTITLNNLVDEISRAYSASLHRQELTAELMQYADLSEWQNELLEDENTAAGREYWRKQDLSDLLTLKLPFEYQPTQTGSEPTSGNEFEPQVITLRLEPELVIQIEKLAQKYETSPAVVLQSCWHILLWRYSGQPNLVIGLAGDGRTHAELKEALGLFARYLPVHSYLEETVPFCEVLTQITAAAQEVYARQEYFSWEQLGDPPGSLEFTFLPFSFDFWQWPAPANFPAADITFSVDRQFVCIDRFKIKLVALQRGDALITEFHYDATLFQATDINRLAGQFQQLLASAANQPEAPIGALNLVTPAERQQLLVEFNHTQTDHPDDRCLHHLFEAQAERTPERVAVVFEGQQLTYAELNGRANQLAHHLQALGVGPETLVAIFVERSLDMIIGMLGVLKAGGAYVPFDPTMPKERLAFLLDDTQAPVLLTQQPLTARLPATRQNLHVIPLDTDWEVIAQQPTQNPASQVQGQNLVYVLFTSGSTGQPKGVAVEHRQLLNYVHSITARLELPAQANYATVSTFAADLGNTVIFPALCGGGCLHVIPYELATDPDALADYFHHHQIDCLKLVPSHLAALLVAAQPEQIMPYQRLVLGGETCHWDLVKKAQALAPDCVIFNHYGPTETTVGVLTYHIAPPATSGPRYPIPSTVPLGRPIANTQIYLLDSSQQPVPIWVPGEVYIGGAGVTRGYLNRPELTAEKFINNPFRATTDGRPPTAAAESLTFSGQSSAVPQGGYALSGRLYRTGDLARYLPDGNIEFLGRIDHQVKIRGFRIELGEIEALLGQHPAVRKTVVLAREDSPGDKRLVAYIVPNPTQAPSSSKLRAFLKEKLPEPMIPTAFILLRKLPLTSNGKIDRRALPAPNAAHTTLDETYVAPHNAIEEALAGLWSNVLGIERIGVHDDFFELGGHSLLAVRLMAQIQKWFGQDIPLATLFHGATIDHLATVLSQKTGSLPQSPLVKIQPAGTNRPFFCVHPADGTVLSYVHLSRYLGSDQPFYGLQITSLNGLHPHQTRLKAMAANYIEALRAIQPEGPYLLGGWSMGGVVAFEMAQQLCRQGQSVALLALLDSWVPDSDPRYPAGYQVLDKLQPSDAEVDMQLLMDFLRHLRGQFAKDLPTLPHDFRQLGLDERLHYVLEQAKMLEFVFPEGGLPQLHRLLQVFKSNVQATSSYVPQVYPGRIVLFQATKWFAAAQHPRGQMPDSAIGWQQLSTKPLEVQPIPGDHYTILSEPHVRVLVEQLKVCLGEAQLIGVIQ